MFNGKILYFDWAIFNSYVCLPEGIIHESMKPRIPSSPNAGPRALWGPVALWGPCQAPVGPWTRTPPTDPRPPGRRSLPHGLAIHRYFRDIFHQGYFFISWPFKVKNVKNVKNVKIPRKLRFSKDIEKYIW